MAEFVKVATISDLPSGKGMVAEANGREIALFNVDGKYYAIDNDCTHVGGSLAEGSVDGNIVTCPLHGATFDITNGKVTGSPAQDDVKGYPVIIEGEDIKIEE